MINRDKKKKLRSILVKISPEDKGELLVKNLEDDLKVLSEKIPKSNSSSIIEINQNLETLKKNYLENIDILSKRITTLSTNISLILKDLMADANENKVKIIETLTKDINVLKEDILKVRKELLTNLGRGGSMNRRITLLGTDILSRYTDINFTGGSSSIDDINKRVNISFGTENFELELARKATGNSYMEYTLDGSGNITNADYWTDSGKDIKLFSKVITWTGTNPTEIVTTDETSGKILTTTIAYSGSTITNVTKVIS